MAELKRFKGTIAYAVGNGQDYPDQLLFLLTVFIPEVDDPRRTSYGSIEEALCDQGLFAQYEIDKLPIIPADLDDTWFKETRDWAARQTGKIAFAVMSGPRGPTYKLGRTIDWKQSSFGPWELPHLANIELTAQDGGSIITYGDSRPNWLQLGTFNFKRRNEAGSFGTCEPTIDLTTGQLMFGFNADKSFFLSMNVSQPFTAARRIGGRSPKYIVSETVAVSVFATESIDEHFECPLFAELDLFPYSNHFTGQCLANYIKRNGFQIGDGSEKAIPLPLTSRDTLGRPLIALLGFSGQYLRIISTPELKHEISDPTRIKILNPGSSLVPQGIFPIAPVSQDPEQSILRRFKLGPSNTEAWEINEQGGNPTVVLTFHINVLGQNGGGIPTGGFFRYSLVAWAQEYETPADIIRQIQEGPVLTDGGDDADGKRFDIVSVWPSFSRSIPNSLGNPSSTYSVQPDAIVRYAPDSPNATSNSLGYQLEAVNLPKGPIPFTFLEGIPDEPFGKPAEWRKSHHSDLELYLSQHRFKVREKQWLLAREGLSPLLARLKDSARGKANITPQGFEVIVGEPHESRLLVLAKSEDLQGNSISLTMEILHVGLRNLFLQNTFILVFPTESVKDMTLLGGVASGIKLTAAVRLGDWGFDLALDKSPSSFELDGLMETPPNNRLLILKYQKGRLRDLLPDDTTWSNWNLLEKNWREDAKKAISGWITKVDDGVGRGDVAYSVIRDILDNVNWTGVLMINPVVDLGLLPPALQSIVAGVDLEFFRGHHLGFTQNKIETNEHNIPSITKSALFGLIDYKDEGSFNNEERFEFRVHELKVLFANSEVQDFSCLLKVRIPKWFDDAVKQATGGPDIYPKPPKDVFGILGRYESFIDSTGKKINRYSFIWDDDIALLNSDWFIFDKAIIDRIELRTTESKDLEEGAKKLIRSELLINAIVAFKEVGDASLSDIFGFKELELSGLSIPFEVLLKKEGGVWKKDMHDWLPKLSFDGISLGTDLNRRRENSLLTKFPVKFKSFRFFDKPKQLSDFKFAPLYTTAGDTFEYGFEWNLDFGALAKMLGLDSSLNGSLLVGWVPGSREGKAGVSIGLRFDDMGGDRLDIGIGSVLRLQAGYFDIFSPGNDNKGTFIVASDLKIEVFGNKLPKGDDKFGLLLAPNPDNPLKGPLGWLTSVCADELGFIQDFSLSIGQKLEYRDPAGNSPEQIIERIKSLARFNIAKEDKPEIKKKKTKKFRETLDTTFKYSQNNEWFIALSGEVAKVMRGYALYNPPTLFGGEVGIPGLSIAILYKQETPQLGIYTGTLTLSDELRSIDLGGVRIQLPRISVKFDTDGGYAIIAGLNLEKPDDFSNAAGAEVGIFKGDGGFMFAQIHGSAFRKEIRPVNNHTFPKETWGMEVYSPITRIMLAARVGLGREFNKGILKAGASITIYGILSGTWAKRNLMEVPHLPFPETERNRIMTAFEQGLPEHYNKFWGEIGVIAEIYGVVDFGVTRQRLDARLLVGIGVTFETWQDTLAFIRGELHISLDWEIARIKLIFKTIVIRVHLSFSTEYREEYVLQAGDKAKWDQWFSGVQGLSARAQFRPQLAAKAISIQAPNWGNTPPTPSPDQRVAMPLLVTLDFTLDDNGDPRLVPLVFIPFQTTLDRSMIQDPGGTFKALVNLVFDWSLAAFMDPLPDKELPLDTLRAIEREVMKRDWSKDIGSRGSWQAERAWMVLCDHFVFSLGNEGEIASGTVLMLPSGFKYSVKFSDGSEETKVLGETKVDERYLIQLNMFFDELRVKVKEERGNDAGNALADGAMGAPRHLVKFLFEEYLESVMLAVWGRISMALDRKKWDDPPTVRQIHDFLTTENNSEETKAISDMINRQVFSGSRVPTDASKPRGQIETAALFEYADLAIDISEWNLDIVESLTLKHEQIGHKVIFEIDSQMDEIKPPSFGDTRICQDKPYIYEIGSGDRHPLVGPVEIEGTNETMWTVPEALSAKVYDLKWGQPPLQSLKVALETHSDGETKIFASREQHGFNPMMLIALPVADVKTGKSNLPGVFQLRQMAEADRRLLDDFLSSAGEIAYDIEFFAETSEDNGRVVGLSRPQIVQKESFIGRVNLSVDPNPTSFKALLFARFADDLPLRASPVLEEYQNFLRLLHLAAETNSGGYVLRLSGSGWKDQTGTERIWLGIRLHNESLNPILPSFANRILTTAKGFLVLREDAVRKDGEPWQNIKQAIPLGEPGVLSATVVRSNPDTLYHAPTGPGPRVLTRTQVLSWLETMTRLDAGTLQYLDSRGALPANILDGAGGEEVELSKRFNLLHINVKKMGGFKEMCGKFDLPAGPERRKEEKDNPYAPYRYRWSVPAYRLLEDDGHADNDLYQGEPEPFIYASIGHAMTVRAGFRDVLGYSPETANLNMQEELYDKYFDPLLSILSLSGLSVGHKLDRATGQLKIHLRFVPYSLVDKIPIPPEKDEVLQRVRSVRASYARAMQQIRDKNTTISVESTLGFPGGDGGAPVRNLLLTDNERLALYDYLKLCRNQLDLLAESQSDQPIGDMHLSFLQAGIVPKDGFAPYRILWCVERPDDSTLAWAEIAAMPRSKVISVAADVPLLDQKPDELACAIADKFTDLRLTHTRDGRNEETLYLIDANLVKMELPSLRDGPAFAALTPLSTVPYAKSQALVWDWSAHRDGPDGTEWPKVEISGFDQDAAFLDLLRDMDLLLSPSSAAALWSEPNTAGLLDELLHAKNKLAKKLPERVISILDNKDDIEIIAAKQTQDALQKNLENSFKKHLERVRSVDTILAVPLTYKRIGASDQFLLYGSITTNAENTSQFYPAALRRDGDQNTLIVQFDARQPAQHEIYELPLSFSIEYVRVDIDGNQSPFGAIWLKLFDPVSVPLTRNNNKVNIPVLFKKLLTKPSISIANPGPSSRISNISEGDSLEEVIKKARQWTFIFDIERTRAAAQDDVLIDVVYNNQPPGPVRLSAGDTKRELGEILFEYVFYRGILPEPSQRLKSFVYWSTQVAEALPAAPHKQPALMIRNGPKSVKHDFTLFEKHTSDLSRLNIVLCKPASSTWDHHGFDFSIKNIDAQKDPSGDREENGVCPRNGEPLKAISIARPQGDQESGEYYAGRRIEISKLDILKFENVWPSTVIQRNATLGDVYTVQQPFVYQTDRIQPGESFTPFLEVSQAVNLEGADIASALKKLFEVLLDGIDEGEWPLIDLGWGYDSGQLDVYKENDPGMLVFGKDPIGLFTPLQPKKDNLSREESLEKMISIVTNSIREWEKKNINGNPPSSGRYVFELRVFSRLERIEKPLLRLTDIRWNL